MTEALLEGYALPPVSPEPYDPAAKVVSLAERRDPPGWVALARAERAAAEGRPADALSLATSAEGVRGDAQLAFRTLVLRAAATLTLGDVEGALELAERANDLARGPQFSDVDRAEALYQLGCCRFKRAEAAKATSLLTVALQLCDGARLPSDRLRAAILEWRSRCYQLQRDLPSAQADIERALELVGGVGESSPAAAHVYFQASAVAERRGDTRLARFYAEEAESIYRAAGDTLMLARILNNLGGLLFLQGDEAGALLRLQEAVAAGLSVGSDADVAQATSSAAQVHLRCGRLEAAEEHARSALARLGSRIDFLDEIGNVQLVLGRALLAQRRLAEAREVLADAEESFSRLGSTSHVAAVWVAQGDLARVAGDTESGAELYRRAAEALQDFHF